MIYFYLYPYFRAFFDTLGIEFVTSPPTSQKLLDDMTICPTDELCVPIKLTFAHAQQLREQGATHLFLPTLVSIDPGNYCCPKFIGLPKMVARAVGFDTGQLLNPEFNYREEPGVHRSELFEVARTLGVKRPEVINRALDAAEEAQGEFLRLSHEEGHTVIEAIEHMYGKSRQKRREKFNPRAEYDPEMHIGVIGHPYVMHDILGHQLVERLREYGEVTTPEMVDPDAVEAIISSIYQGERMWTFEGEKLGAAFHLMRSNRVDRLVLIGPFGCGPQSVMENFIMAEAERLGIPFLHLTVDEHTGEGGLVTRLEAFMDMRRTTETPEPGEDLADGKLDPSRPVRGPQPRERLVGTPSMGLLNVALETIMETCGVDVVPTPELTQELINRGYELAPEFICYPLVGVTGQIEKLLEMGADTILMITGKGRCRAGWYGQVQKVLLDRAGYDFDMILIDAPLPLDTNWEPFKNAVHSLTGGVSWLKVIQGIYFGYRKMEVLDHADELTRELRAYERSPGTADELLDELVEEVRQASSIFQLRRAARDFEAAASEIPRIDVNPLRVQVLGEIYVVLEPAINKEIEKILASDERLRVHVLRELSASEWFAQHVLRHPGLWRRYHEVAEAAKPYVDQHLGGHGMEDVGLTVLAAEEDIDGMVHLVPFTCMPELVAQNVLTHVSRDLDMPVLSLIISEQTGEAGFVTRVQAFLDTLVERRRRADAELPLVARASVQPH
jgi:predicted nucleotide-binding protein (sugar kinase/HSP70/actin superfamily)